MSLPNKEQKIAIIGAGPAGLACADTLAQEGYRPIIYERERQVGGLCRTLDFEGYLFDIGGHRFLTKSKPVMDLWHEVMGEDMLRVKRTSRIYFSKHFFKYPMSFFDVFFKLGPLESIHCVWSWLLAKIKLRLGRGAGSLHFEGWVINAFGKRLYEIFFKSYTEKVWAVPCVSLSADWATQRIRGLSLRVALREIFFGKGKNSPKTLAEEFLYPRTGPGEFYQRFKERIQEQGGQTCVGREIEQVRHEGGKIISILLRDRRKKTIEEVPVDFLFSSIPLPLLIQALTPQPPEDVLEASRQLRFRSFLVVNVILNIKDLFPDQWLYIQDPEVKLGRVQNYKNWSPAMVLDMNKTSLGLEYFCTEDDPIWEMDDVMLMDFAMKELHQVGICGREHLINGFVVRYANAYPVYSMDYQKHVRVIKDYLSHFKNLRTMGRAGVFHYDNSDYALLSGMYSAKNFLGESDVDIWKLNMDQQYLES